VAVVKKSPRKQDDVRLYFGRERLVIMRRTEDWLRQAKKDLGHAHRSMDMEDYEWSCFSAQQSAEKAVKALYESLGAHVLGHSVSTLLQKLPKQERPDVALVNEAKLLDRHYVPTRYINSHPEGAPMDYYTRQDAIEALLIAERVQQYCEDRIRRTEKKG
jgi:HEPN domain-containing protein